MLGARLIAGGALLAVRSVAGGPLAGAATEIPAAVGTSAPLPVTAPTAAPLPRSAPVRIEIPALHVSARSCGSAWQPAAPSRYRRWVTTTWPTGTTTASRPASGARRSSWATSIRSPGASVFSSIKTLRPGNMISFVRANGSTAVFTVNTVQKIAKSAFPASEVYGKVSFPSLRLVTCGGPFDTTTRQYLDNVVVYAHLITSAR